MDEIDRNAALVGREHLLRALEELESVKHRLALAYACSDLCDMAEIIPPIATIMTCVSIKIASVEATAKGTDKPFPKLRLVKG